MPGEQPRTPRSLDDLQEAKIRQGFSLGGFDLRCRYHRMVIRGRVESIQRENRDEQEVPERCLQAGHNPLSPHSIILSEEASESVGGYGTSSR